jgi:phage terminase large subunit-like protein
MVHGSRGRSVTAVELRRRFPGDVEVGDVNQGHRRLVPVLAKVPSSVVTTHRRRCGGFKARAVLGFADGAQGLGRRLGFR